jgi:hypothetical protein
VFVPLAAVSVAFGGFAIAYAATDSGTDTPHDAAERGLDAGAPPVADDTPPATDVPDGTTETFPAGVAGTVTIGRTGATLSVVAVGTNPGWAAEVEQASGPEVEVEFRNGTARIDLEAELEDGAVRVRVRERTEIDDDVTPPTSPTSPTSPTTPATRVDNSGPGSVNSGRDDEPEDEREDEHEIDDDHSGSSNSGSGSSGSSNSGSGSSGSGHSGSGSGD